jgi:hypothetical protein
MRKAGWGINSVTACVSQTKIRLKGEVPFEDRLAERMQVVPFPARQARAFHRHEVVSLTHVSLDGHGGILRNLSSRGIGVQAISPLRPQQRVQLRFNLRSPRLKVDAEGQVMWSDSFNLCGIAFVDLPSRVSRQIDEWIFSNLIEIAHRRSESGSPIFASSGSSALDEEDVSDDGLTLSPTARQPIRLEMKSTAQLNWLSRPLSPRTIAWAVDGLLVLAAMLLFILIFLSIAHELPSWEMTLGAGSAIGIFILLSYRGLFSAFGGGTFGNRLTRTAPASSPQKEKTDEDLRFR